LAVRIPLADAAAVNWLATAQRPGPPVIRAHLKVNRELAQKPHAPHAAFFALREAACGNKNLGLLRNQVDRKVVE
jgi:hypothetical protein